MRFLAKVGLFAAAAAVAHADTPVTHVERFELSAPLLPEEIALGAYEGPNYPTSAELRGQLVREHTKTFDELLTACAPNYPAITLPAEGVTLTSDQLATNYANVAKCAYEQFTAKPYWIPQLIDDVDVCSAKLGSDWRLLAESDLALLDAADFSWLRDTLNGVASDGLEWAPDFFGTDFYVRANDGSLQRGSFDPAASPRVTPIIAAWDGQMGVGATRTYHYEGNLGVRCIRRTIVNQ